MYIIGVTGGVGAGKSAILHYIEEHYDCEVYLADQVAHIVKEPGQPCYFQLVELLGADILQEDGKIDKSRMAAKIFADGQLLQKVNDLIHPAVRIYLEERIRLAAEKGVSFLFIEAALLIETGYKNVVDELWYIYAEEPVRRTRLRTQRNYSEEKITQIMGSQLTEETFRKECDFVVDNSGDLKTACEQIDERLKKLISED